MQMEASDIRKKPDVGYPVLGFLFCPIFGFISLHFYKKAKEEKHLNTGSELYHKKFE